MNQKQPSALALGTFDGLHEGHRAVLYSALSMKKLNPICITFATPPKALLKGAGDYLLMTPEIKERELYKMGFSQVVFLDFSMVRGIDPNTFLDNIFNEYNVKLLACGYNYHFGENGRGDTELLENYCRQHSIQLVVAPKVSVGDVAVSSSEIRRLLSQGKPEAAAKMLGTQFFMEAVIEHGDQRGRTIGFPTINQELPTGVMVPKLGVYASLVSIDGNNYRGITNMGFRPTYELKRPRLETFIFDFDEEVYGKIARVSLCEFLRDEAKFNSLDELKAAISDSKVAAEAFFTKQL